jgi:outer membrane protein assembly factor BamB
MILPPAVDDGEVYVCGLAGGLYALDAGSGDVLQKYQTGNSEELESPPIKYGGYVYTTSSHYIYAIDVLTGGQKSWSLQTGDTMARASCPPPSTLAVSGSKAYFGYGDYLYAVDAFTGQERWRFKAGKAGNFVGSPIVSGSVVYVGSCGGSDDSYLYAVDANTGQEIWRFKTVAQLGDPPAVSEGVVYIGGDDSYLYAVDANTGQEIWRFKAGDWYISQLAVSGDAIYFTCGDHYLYAINK